MVRDIKQGLLFTLATMIVFGGGYHLVLWAVATFAFPDQAQGSLVRNAQGSVVGSRLLAQKFDRPEYFYARPSAVDYDAASSGASNYGPTNPKHLNAVRERLAALTDREGVSPSHVPSEMVTASGGGLDPDIPPEGADIQVARVARTRGVDPARVRALVRQYVELPTFGFLGRPRINVLKLNLAMDRELGSVGRQRAGR